jgi:hypothetical protein
MSDRHPNWSSENVKPAAASARLPYQAPKLVRLGSVRDLTLGGSGGAKPDMGTPRRAH